MMSGIYAEIANSVDDAHASRVYYECSHDGGSNFVTRLNQMLDTVIYSYISGYCTGVFEALLGDIEVTLTCKTCPMKNKFKSECVFDISLTMEDVI